MAFFHERKAAKLQITPLTKCFLSYSLLEGSNKSYEIRLSVSFINSFPENIFELINLKIDFFGSLPLLDFKAPLTDQNRISPYNTNEVDK